MALWLVLEDFAGDIKRIPTGSFSMVLAGTLLDDALVNIPDAKAQGLPTVEYAPASMATALAQFSAKGRQPPQSLNNDGNLLALLYASGAVGGSGASFTFRPGVAPVGPNVFDDWAALYAAIEPFRLSGVAFVVSVDLTNIGGAFAVPIGVWDFGGACVFSGMLAFSGPKLQLGIGVTIQGLAEVTQILTFESLGGIIKLSATRLLALTRGGSLLATGGVVLSLSGPTGTVAMLNGGSMVNNGSPVVDMSPGETLQVIGSSAAQLSVDAIAGAVGSTLVLLVLDLSAILTTAQTGLLGSLFYQVVYPPMTLTTLSAGQVPVAVGVYFLAAIAGIAYVATVTDDSPWYAYEVGRRQLLTHVLAFWSGTTVIGDTADIELLVNGVSVANATGVAIDAAGSVTFPVSVASLGVPLAAGDILSARVTHAGLLGNPPRMYVQPLAA